MCGICGKIVFDNTSVDKGEILSMMSAMKHRGPDDDGTFVRGNIGLGHVRLSIIDLSDAGHQPMISKDGRYVIVYNGEIYNYIELRKQLAGKYQFHTDTDTEVLLNAYREWGDDCLKRLNGMFAFVVYDTRERSLFGVRDRFGIKPFYYYCDEKQFIFASEIPPILRLLDRSKIEPDDRTVFDYLVFNRTDQTERTFFNSVKKLQHGSKFTYKSGKLRFSRWYDLENNLDRPFESAQEYKETLSSAVGLRLRSDVPVGVCLSGGLDSSSIVSLILKDHNKNDINTFSAVYGAGKRGDESEFISEYDNQLNNMHFTHPTHDTLFADIPKLVNAHAEPVPDTSIYAQYKVMELAKQHVVVTLDGQGADEQLAGYHYFFGFYFKQLLQELSIQKLCSEMYFYLRNHRSLFGLKTFLYFLLPNSLKAQAKVSEIGYLNEDFQNNYKSGSAVTDVLYTSPNLQQALLNHFELKLEHLLKWEDRNSMNFSLESRVPFLDHRLVERTLATSSNELIQRGTTKHILRESMQGILPERIRNRSDKVGFSSPEAEWFRTPKFKDFFRDILNSNSFASRGYINKERAITLFESHLSGRIDVSREIWKWINLELWFRDFIDTKDEPTIIPFHPHSESSPQDVSVVS